MKIRGENIEKDIKAKRRKYFLICCVQLFIPKKNRAPHVKKNFIKDCF